MKNRYKYVSQYVNIIKLDMINNNFIIIDSTIKDYQGKKFKEKSSNPVIDTLDVLKQTEKRF